MIEEFRAFLVLLTKASQKDHKSHEDGIVEKRYYSELIIEEKRARGVGLNIEIRIGEVRLNSLFMKSIVERENNPKEIGDCLNIRNISERDIQVG